MRNKMRIKKETPCKGISARRLFWQAYVVGALLTALVIAILKAKGIL